MNMKKTVTTALLAGLIFASTQAQTSLDQRPARYGGDGKMDFLFNGKTYRRASGWCLTPDLVRISSAQDGAVSVPWESLPPSWKAALQERRTAKIADEEKKADRVQQQAAGVDRVDGKVLSVTSEGLLLSRSGDVTIFLKKYPKTVVDGDYVKALGVAAGTFQYKTVLGAQATVRAYSFLSE